LKATTIECLQLDDLKEGVLASIHLDYKLNQWMTILGVYNL